MEVALRALTVAKGESVVLAPLGDLQWSGRREFIAADRLERHIDEALTRNAWFVGTGDYVDAFSPSNRQRLRSAALYDTAEQVLADKTRELVDELMEKFLRQTKGRWLGLVEGHHWANLMTGETTDQYLAKLLDAPFLGNCAMIGLQFPTDYGVRTVEVWVHHGAGGGQKAHAPILKLENAATYWDADIMILGHMTKRGTAPIQREYVNWATKGGPRLRSKTMHLVGAGGWLLGYPQGSRFMNKPTGPYPEQKMLNPVSLGAPFVTIKPYVRSSGTGNERERHWEPDIRVEA